MAVQDGGVTSYDNPAFLLSLMATLEPYRLRWPTGPGKMLLVSMDRRGAHQRRRNGSQRVSRLDAVDRIPDLQQIGKALARQRVQASLFGGFA